jgi:hypothetical protein
VLAVVRIVLTVIGEQQTVKNTALFSVDSSPHSRIVSSHCHTLRVHVNRILRTERVTMWTEVICPMWGYCEHGDKHSVSILWWNVLTIWVTKNFLRSSGVKIHFTFLHTCNTQLNSSLLLCLTCRFVITFREVSPFLLTGPAFFGSVRDVSSMLMVMVTVSLETVITNFSATAPDRHCPWPRFC